MARLDEIEAVLPYANGPTILQRVKDLVARSEALQGEHRIKLTNNDIDGGGGARAVCRLKGSGTNPTSPSPARPTNHVGLCEECGQQRQLFKVHSIAWVCGPCCEKNDQDKPRTSANTTEHRCDWCDAPPCECECPAELKRTSADMAEEKGGGS